MWITELNIQDCHVGIRRESMQTSKDASARETNRGPKFTLVEVLIVVILLGILAIGIVPRINVSTEGGKLNTLADNLTHIENANIAFQSKEDRFKE